jgi:hypothetical protein
MTDKLKNRLRNMNFQRQITRDHSWVDSEDTKYYEELYSRRTRELLGTNNEDISGITRGGLRSQHI